MFDIFVGALIFAIWSVVLFYGKAVGLSVLLFAIPITYFTIYLLEKRNTELNKKAKVLIIPIALLSCTYFIYNNIFFNIVNIFVILSLLFIMILALYKVKFEIGLNTIKMILKVVFEPFSNIGEALKKSRNIFKEKKNYEVNSEKNKKIKRVVKAVIITIPVVFVILWLLSSADEEFGKIFGNIIEKIVDIISRIQLSNVVEVIILSLCAFVYLIGFFYFIAFKLKSTEENAIETKKRDSFTIKMILSALNIIYFIFCYIQVKSLFMRNVSINYAEYARQGFFQLMLVSIINLFTVLIAKKREKQEEQKGKFIRIMCLIMVAFTFIILISAAYRMHIYETAYGYTLLRLLVYCVLFTEAVLLIPTIWYIIDEKINLAKTYFSIVITIYILMNFANFDNIIAKRNVDRYEETGKIDLIYLELNTGTDAVNQIMRILDVVEKKEGTTIETKAYLKNMYKFLESEEMDFRDFNVSKIIAKRKIEEKLLNYIKKDYEEKSFFNEDLY